MKRRALTYFILILACAASCHGESSAADVVSDIYNTCLSQYSLSCAKAKSLAWISEVSNKDVIQITEDLSIVRTGSEEATPLDESRGHNVAAEIVDKIDSFLATHSLKMNAPEILKSKEARSFVPKSLLKGGLAEDIQVPLTEGNIAEGRGFVRKVMIPFLLGLKLKTTVLVPLALALIALKTWKAMTLGLLSLVLSGALVIFKLTKPKVVNYEVVHYPQHHVEHHVDHITHAHAHAPHGWEPHGWARSIDAQQMAYAGQV